MTRRFVVVLASGLFLWGCHESLETESESVTIHLGDAGYADVVDFLYDFARENRLAVQWTGGYQTDCPKYWYERSDEYHPADFINSFSIVLQMPGREINNIWLSEYFDYPSINGRISYDDDKDSEWLDIVEDFKRAVVNQGWSMETRLAVRSRYDEGPVFSHHPADRIVTLPSPVDERWRLRLGERGGYAELVDFLYDYAEENRLTVLWQGRYKADNAGRWYEKSGATEPARLLSSAFAFRMALGTADAESGFLDVSESADDSFAEVAVDYGAGEEEWRDVSADFRRAATDQGWRLTERAIN